MNAFSPSPTINITNQVLSAVLNQAYASESFLLDQPGNRDRT